jgi:hypothetical protein
MSIGAAALLIYASVVSYLVLKFRLPAVWVSLAAATGLGSLVLA